MEMHANRSAGVSIYQLHAHHMIIDDVLLSQLTPLTTVSDSVVRGAGQA